MKLTVSAATTGFTGAPNTGSLSSLAIGTFGAASSGQFWDGGIDCLRLYSRALSLTEIRQLNTEPYAGTYSLSYNLVGSTVVDANVNLAGVAATAAVGTLGYTLDASHTLTGVQATAAAGTFASAVDSTVALSGVQATAAVGTLTASASATFALEGVQATAYAGDLTPVTDFLNVPLITIMNDDPIPVDAEMTDDEIPGEGTLPYQIAFEGVINTNPIPMSGTMIGIPVPGEGSVP